MNEYSRPPNSHGAVSDPIVGDFIKQDDLARTFSRSYSEEADIAFSAIDCVLNGEKAVYASSELTTGRRVNSMLREIGARHSSELRPTLGDENYVARIWNPNVAAAISFARNLYRLLGRNDFVVTPAPFTAPGWNQSEYLAFWEQLIRSRIKAVYFNKGWEYSNGCVFEFLVALDCGLPTYDAEGNPLAYSTAMSLLESAISTLQQDAQEYEVLASYLKRLQSSPSASR